MSSKDPSQPPTPAPYCHHRIYDDAQRRPHGGNYISEEDRPPHPKPWWLLAGIALGLYLKRSTRSLEAGLQSLQKRLAKLEAELAALVPGHAAFQNGGETAPASKASAK